MSTHTNQPLSSRPAAFPFQELMAMEPRAAQRPHAPLLEVREPDLERVGTVAVLRIEGPLLQRGGWFWDGYETIQARFAEALQDPGVSAILLRINSPGGVSAGCFEAVRAMRRAKAAAGKPVVAFADEAAYSAAFAIATVADEIYLPEPGGVGSVGVIGVLFDVTALTEAIGIKVVVVSSGALKADGHHDVPLSQGVVDRYQERIDDLGRQFAALVGEARGKTTEQVLALEAGCFYGQGAVDKGLADGVMSLADAIGRAESLGARPRGAAAPGPNQQRAAAPAPSPTHRTDEAHQRYDQLVRRTAAAALGSSELDPTVRAAIAGAITREAGGDPAVPRPDGLRMRQAQLRAVREDVREAEFVASTEAVNSFGEVDRQNWRLDRYMRNPIVLFAHDIHSLPIGRAAGVRVEDGQLLITVRFASARANPFAELCWQSVLEKTLNAGSTGFVSHNIRQERIAGVMRTVCDDNELYEFSLAPVPSNPDALVRVEQRVAAALHGHTRARSIESMDSTHARAAHLGQTIDMPRPQAREESTTMKTKAATKITDDEFAELRQKGTLAHACDGCGAKADLAIPQVAAMAGDLEKTQGEHKAAKACLEAITKAVSPLAADGESTDATVTRLAAEHTAMRKREIAATQLQPLVDGGRLTADEVPDYVELAIENPERFRSLVAKAAARPGAGEHLLNKVEIGADPSPPHGDVAGGNNVSSGAILSAIVTRAANVPTNAPGMSDGAAGVAAGRTSLPGTELAGLLVRHSA